MKRILLIILTLLSFASAAVAEDCTCTWGVACSCPMAIFDYATGRDPYTGALGGSDCFLKKDSGARANPDANPTLTAGDSMWIATFTATETEFRKASFWCKSGSNDYLFQPVTIRTDDAPNGFLQSCGGCAANEVKLASTETAGDYTLRESWFYAQKGDGAGQTIRICDWIQSTKIATLCETPEVAFSTNTAYALIASANPFTRQQRHQMNDALGLDGDKVTSTGGVLQAMYDLNMAIDAVTTQFEFTTPGRVDASATVAGGGPIPADIWAVMCVGTPTPNTVLEALCKGVRRN